MFPRVMVCVASVLLACGTASAQEHQHEHMNMPMGNDTTWQVMQDGQLYALFNHQGGPRGGDEFKAPNWWMAMVTRNVGAGQLTFNGMFSLDPATAGKAGYRELFQVGEALDGRPLIDRQHPHDLFMQLAAVWRVPVSDSTSVTVAGGPAGEPALGPIAFMHRASAENIPLATLSHHTLDSSHIAYGVITAAVDRGPWTLEGSLFNGREPDERRWDFDFGRLDSVAGRVWFRPTDTWEFQASTGHLVDPEELEPGNIQRTTASASWFSKASDLDFSAVTIGYGVNAAHGTLRHAVFGEITRRLRVVSASVRAEMLQVESDLLLTDTIPSHEESSGHRDIVGALTVGASRDLFDWNGLQAAIGGDVTVNAVPDALRPSYGAHPLSYQLFVRFRPQVGGMGRMWNMRMLKPMHH